MIDLVERLRANPRTNIFDLCDEAADRIEELESHNETLRELISEVVESKTVFQTQWDKDALDALEQMEKAEIVKAR